MKKKRTYVFDSEIYRNYFCVRFKDVETKKLVSWEMEPGDKLDRRSLREHIESNLIIGFNSANFDIVILYAAIAGFSVKKLKEIADDIIRGDMKPWDIEREYKFKIPKPWEIDHIDLIEVAPGKASLKLYNGRLHGRRMQDLPYPPDAVLTPEQIDETYKYCGNDLDATLLLWESLSEQIKLREGMSREYGIDLRSKSDAQVAEAVIKREVKRILGRDVKRPEVRPGASYNYNVPHFIRFEGSELNRILDIIAETKFRLNGAGSMMLPESLSEAEIRINDGVYRLGIGGLHSSESSVAHLADDEYVLIDRDVTSYYPAIIIGQNLHPPQMGKAFQQVYKRIVARRIEAKRVGNKVEADSLKITINGSFGKFGSKWSALFAPQLMIQTTITGQLSLLMLIEALELEGIQVVSANTDGIVIKCRRSDLDFCHEIIRWWERRTGYQTEETEYRALYSRDVNNYIAIKPDGSVKRKGAYADPGMMKNPSNVVCSDAVVAFLRDGTPINKFIRQCDDIRKFVTVRTVQGGALDQQGNYLGKAIRWYYSTEVEGVITYAQPTAKGTYKKVSRTDGARPLMTLPDEFPKDVDYQWYINEARSILVDVGYAKDVI